MSSFLNVQPYKCLRFKLYVKHTVNRKKERKKSFTFSCIIIVFHDHIRSITSIFGLKKKDRIDILFPSPFLLYTFPKKMKNVYLPQRCFRLLFQRCQNIFQNPEWVATFSFKNSQKSYECIIF